VLLSLFKNSTLFFFFEFWLSSKTLKTMNPLPKATKNVVAHGLKMKMENMEVATTHFCKKEKTGLG